jgi:hypothetical protein
MKIFIIAIICFLFASCQNTSPIMLTTADSTVVNNNDSTLANGYWQIPEGSRFVRLKNEVLSPGNHLFLYDSTCIIISLLTEKAWMWRSKDDYYKLKAKWGHDSLFYLPPFGQWSYLAKFDGANFSVTLQDSVFTYFKIDKTEISKDDIAILKERKLHDYTIKATDRWDE